MMKRIFFISILIIYTFSSCSRKVMPDTNPITVRVMSYNIHHANPPSRNDGYIDIEAVASVIKKQQPDLVALQELDVRTNRSGKDLDEAKALARTLNMHVYFAKTIDYDGGEYGIGLLSRFPISDAVTYQLPDIEELKGEHRAVAVAKIQLSSKKQLLFASTHLDALRTDGNRILQIKAIDSIFSKQDIPTIIGGDFNASPASEVIRILDRNFVRTCTQDCPFTIPEKNPRKTIDFIAYRPAASFSVVEHLVIDEQYASDHRPVVAVLSIK